MADAVESANPTNGRDAQGRWVKGLWKGGPGRPKKAKELRYLEKFGAAFPPTEFEQAVRKCVDMAKGGDIRAMELLFKYALPRPKPEAESAGVQAENAFVLQVTPEAKEAITDELRRYHNQETVRTIRRLPPNPPAHEDAATFDRGEASRGNPAEV